MQIQLTNHSYDILIQKGALKELASWVTSLWQPQRIAIITDSNVAPLYAEAAQQQLIAAGFPTQLLVVPAGEASKSLEQAGEIIRTISRSWIYQKRWYPGTWRWCHWRFSWFCGFHLYAWLTFLQTNDLTRTSRFKYWW